MQRREFSQASALAVLGASALATSAAFAQSGKPVAGTDYQVLDPRAPVDAAAGKVEVVEFFWYNCPHCSTFEPTLQAWLKKLPAHIAFRRMPVAFNNSFLPQQKLYFTLEAMGLVEKLHARVFVAIHGERQNLSTAEKITDWVAKQGVDAAAFTAQYNSFSVAAKASRATQLQNAYKVEGVPSLGVAGRFYTDGSLARSMERALTVVDALVADVRAGR